MSRIPEADLILPSLSLININKTISTSDLIKKLRKLLNPEEEDLDILEGRKDDKFSQKVRNLKSHGTLERDGYAIYNNGIFTITKKGKDFLMINEKYLSLVIQEEQFLSKYSETISNYYNEFNESIKVIIKLAGIEKFTIDNLKIHFFNMLYSSVITCLETYLSDAIKFNINNDKDKIYLRKFVETFEEYEKEKITFNNIFSQFESIDNKVEDNLVSLLYHNLPKIRVIYKSTFNIEFKDIKTLMIAISIRHDLVHRNGKMKSGKTHNITKKNILNLCKEVLGFVKHIEARFKKF